MNNNLTDNKNSRAAAATWMSVTGLLLIAVATLMPLLHIITQASSVIYTAGAVVLLIARVVRPGYRGRVVRVKRLMRIEFWAAVIFCVGAFFLWYPGAGPLDWLAFTLAGGMLEAYTSLMIPRAEKKGE